MDSDNIDFEDLYPKRGVGRPKIFESHQDRIRYHDYLKNERKKLKRFILMHKELSESPFDEIRDNLNLYITAAKSMDSEVD